MGKRPPERYNPGELDKTRANLGSLSKEEAARMAALLGGEVGVEKTSDKMKEKYDDLKKRTEKKSQVSYKPASQFKAPKVHTGGYKSVSTRKRKISYIDRIRMDLLAARPEHRIKTRGSIIHAYLRFISGGKDIINPNFLIHGDRYFFSHIQTLQASTAKLLAFVEPATLNIYVNPFYRNILKSLVKWDLEYLNNEMGSLQRSPRNKNVIECSELCRLIYKPIIRLSRINIDHITSALDRLNSLILILTKFTPDEYKNLEPYYLNARDKIPVVFKDVAYTCYPLLLKLSGSQFHFYKDFLKKDRRHITGFLALAKEDLISPPMDMNAELKKQKPLGQLEEILKKQEEERLMKNSIQDMERDESEITAGIELLEKLFPEAGWKQYKEFPDLYQYFQPLYDFPRGVELIPPDDPLHQIITLADTVQELLYGFRNVNILSSLGADIDEITDKWHLFIDEMIQKNYCKMLLEYARAVEKGAAQNSDSFGMRLLTDLLWYRRRFILPKQKFKTLYKSQVITMKAPKFYLAVRKLYSLLDTLLKDFDESRDKSMVIENFAGPFKFEIKNITAIRLKQYLNREKVAATNENLLRYTLMILSVLDFLINSEKSITYQDFAEDLVLFRHDPVYQNKPLYSVNLLDTHEILKKY